ncbi:MAG TPA: two-component system VirA-like sensor kinase [Steroidobacteraceae bacterium]
MRLTYIAAVAMVALGLLAWLRSHTTSSGIRTSDSALHALDAFVLAESELHRDVLRARVGMLRNYDSLVHEDNAIQTALQHIPDSARLADLVSRQEEMIEQFKTRNALLQNSLAYFELFSARLVTRQGALAEQVGKLTVAMLRLTFDTSPAVVDEVDQRLAEVSSVAARAPDETLSESIIAHGRMLRALLPATDDLVKSLFAVPIDSEQARIRGQLLEQQRISDLRGRKARYVLIATSLVLFALLVHLGLRLRSRALALRRRAAIEHMITGISTRFIRFRPQEIEPLIEQALAELARFIQADRAYCLMQAHQDHLYTWRRSGESFPAGWPQSAISLARRMGADDRGVIQVLNVGARTGSQTHEVLSAVGVTEWLCICGASTARLTGLLAFDFVHTRSSMSPQELGLLRMALDAISNAIERHSLERDRERLETNLQHARRMETVGALTSGIAHNFNNIVGAILGFIENAQLQLPADSPANDSLSEIRRAGGRARDLVEQILAFGRRRTVRRSCISVQEWLDEITAVLEATLPPHVRLVVQEVAAEIKICGEPTSLQQAILNVCNNAAQAMDSPGVIRIEIELSGTDTGAAAVPAELTSGQYVLVSVIDSGRGMDEATLERVFEPFFTTRSEGNGLGLPMVRQIVTEHGGAVRIRSTPGAGTRVDFWLPRASPVELATLNDADHMRWRGGGETVLVVESDHERLLRHEEILAALGFEPVGLARGADAEAAYLADSTRFDAALYCAHLQDGATVLADAARLAEMAPHLPILLASSSPSDLAAPSLAEAGIAEVVRQPLSSVELAGALARCLVPSATLLGNQPQLLPL